MAIKNYRDHRFRTFKFDMHVNLKYLHTSLYSGFLGGTHFVGNFFLFEYSSAVAISKKYLKNKL